MDNKNKHIHISECDYARFIVISDIHAHSLAFQKMLDLVDLKPDDLLIINGDFLDRGHNSLAVMAMMMELSKRQNVRVLAGNHEIFMLDFVRRKKFKKKIRRLVDTAKHPTMIYEMYHQLKHQGVKLQSDPVELSKQIKKAFKAEFEFIKHLPVILESEHFIFVHSAYEDTFTLDDNFYDYIKNDDFAKTTGYHDKMVVIGHMPVYNFTRKPKQYAPIFLKNKNIYLIDGGLGVLDDGALNALVINLKNTAMPISFLQV